MSDKEMVLEAVQRLPESATLEEISEEVAIMAAIRRGQADLAAGRVHPQEEVEKMVAAWVSK